MDLPMVTVMKAEHNGTASEQLALKKEQAYIRQLLGVEEDESKLPSEPEVTKSIQTCDDLVDDSDRSESNCVERTTSDLLSVGDNELSLDEETKQEKTNKCVSFVVDLNSDSYVVNEIEKFNIQNLPLDLQKLLEGINQGISYDNNAPIDNKPDWLDMKKFKIGQTFAQKYYFGLNYSEMISLMVLFLFPGGLEPLIFTRKSGTPFTAFRRYLSTVLRVKSWFENDVWSVDNLGYQNIKTVRAMHLNVSKRLNKTPHKELQNQLRLWGSSNDAAVWCPLKQKIQEDFQSSCPFHIFRPIDNQMPGKVYINQLDMSITQFGFVGLMIMYPDKFGAGSATYEELDGFVHLWKGLGYLLGIEDKYNFCNGTLDEVRQRGHFLINNWAKPNFQHVTEDWEHMSRCMVEGISYYVPGVSFEVSFLYLCWVLGIPAPRLQAALSWGQFFMFYMMKMTMGFTLRLPGMLQLHNWLIRRALNRASSMSPEQLKKLENRTYDYEQKGNFNTRL